MTFREALLLHTKDIHVSKRVQSLREVLLARPSKLRDRRIARLEAHARAHLGLSSDAEIDWSTVDWSKIISGLLQVLLLLLPLFLETE